MMENVNGKSARFKTTRKFGISVVNPLHLVNIWIFCEFTLAFGQVVTFEKVVNETRLSLGDKNIFKNSLTDTQKYEHIESYNRFNKSENSNIKQSVTQTYNATQTNDEDFDNRIREFVASNIFTSNKTSISKQVLYLIKSHKWKRAKRYVNKIQVNERARKSKRSSVRPLDNLTVNFKNLTLVPSLRFAQRPTTRNYKNKQVVKKPVTLTNDKNNSSESEKLAKVSLLGLFELTTHLGVDRWEGKSELAAAKLAVRHINEGGLLPGYSLELITNDTQVSLYELVIIISIK
jgi:hypothetical protein